MRATTLGGSTTRRFADSQRGFTLIELLAALFILTLVILMSLGAFLERNRRMQQASELILVYQALANESEYRRRMPFKTLETTPIEFVSSTDILRPLTPFGTAVKVEPGGDGIKNVTMTVRWHEGAREARLTVVRADTGGGSSFW